MAAAGGDEAAVDAGLLARTALVRRLLPGAARKAQTAFGPLETKDVTAFEALLRPEPSAAIRLPDTLAQKARAMLEAAAPPALAGTAAGTAAVHRSGGSRPSPRSNRCWSASPPNRNREKCDQRVGETESPASPSRGARAPSGPDDGLTRHVGGGQNRWQILVLSFAPLNFVRASALAFGLLVTGAARAADPAAPLTAEPSGVSDTDTRVAVAEALGD